MQPACRTVAFLHLSTFVSIVLYSDQITTINSRVPHTVLKFGYNKIKIISKSAFKTLLVKVVDQPKKIPGITHSRNYFG